MTARKPKRRRRTSGILNIILLIAVIVGILLLYVKFSVRADTKVIYHGTSEKTFNAKGIAVFSEELISASNKGVSIINYADGTRVLAKTHVATIYSGEIDESKSNMIKQLSEKINYLETSMKNQHNNGKSPQSINTVLTDKMKKIASCSKDGNLENVLNETAELKSLISTNNESNLGTKLTELKTQREDVERSITGKKEEYVSKNAGMIYSMTDGYETTITEENTKNADIKMFQSLWNSKPVDYEKTNDNFVYGKIINNYEITVLSLVNSKDMEGIEVGKTVYIRPEKRRSVKIPAIISDISESGGRSLVKLRVTQDIESFLGERKFEFEFVKNTYSGLRVPKEAVRKENNESFVYVIKEGIVRKRVLDVLFEGNDFYIVKEDNLSETGLLLYDLVIIKSKNVSEGMAIGY